MNVNSMYFNSAQVARGEHLDLISLLCKQSQGEDSLMYSDIHILPEDCDALTIEWAQVPWDHSFGGSFQYIDPGEDQVVMLSRILPDGETVLVGSEYEYKEVFSKWVAEHPEWHYDPYSGWRADNEEIEDEEDSE